MTPTETDIKKAYAVANDKAKEYIDSDELFNTFYTIRTKYNLHVDVAGNLALIIDSVILEMLPLTEFPGKLKEILTGSSETEYQVILKTINDDIFTYFRNKVKAEAEAVKKKAEQEAAEDAELERQIAEATARRALEGVGTDAAPALPPPPVQEPTAPVQAAPAPSIVEQKVTTVSAPVQELSKVVQPEIKPAAAPPRYHGTDPYREMPS